MWVHCDLEFIEQGLHLLISDAIWWRIVRDPVYIPSRGPLYPSRKGDHMGGFRAYKWFIRKASLACHGATVITSP